MPKTLKKEDYDFMSDCYFYDLSINQKLAILNFFSVLAASNQDSKRRKYQTAFISQYYKEFGVTGSQFLAYITMGGRRKTVEDLKSINKNNFQSLVLTTAELFGCNEGMSVNEFCALEDWLCDIGLSVEDWMGIMNGEDIGEIHSIQERL